jgi:hypothetical protein
VKRFPPDRTAGLAPIRGDELYAWADLKRRLGLCQRSGREMVRQGLRQVVCGKRRFVLGSDVLIFFKRLADVKSGEKE